MSSKPKLKPEESAISLNEPSEEASKEVSMDPDEDPNRPICFCHAVKLGRIKEEIASGARSFEELQARTNCSTGCGGCEFDVREILEKTSKD